MFAGYALSHPKEFGKSDYNEDAYCGEGEGTWFAVSDGVGSALYSGIWSEELSRAVCEFQSTPQDESFAETLQTARQRWHARIDWSSQNRFQKKKFARHGGSFATLLYANVIPAEQSDSEEITVRLWCYGDCNAFHIRNQECVQCWPYNKSVDFGPAPQSLCSTQIVAPDPECWHSTEIQCNPDDQLLLTTDALAEYLTGELERGNTVDWSVFTDISAVDYADWIEELRQAKRIERDDTTFLLIASQTIGRRGAHFG
jgi:serine/threonine protein phosphatase PrpC